MDDPELVRRLAERRRSEMAALAARYPTRILISRSRHLLSSSQTAVRAAAVHSVSRWSRRGCDTSSCSRQTGMPVSGSFWIGPHVVAGVRLLSRDVPGITALHERGASSPFEADSAVLYQARMLSIFSARASTSARCSTIKQGEAV